MDGKNIKDVKAIQAEYEDHEITKVEKLKQLDRKVRLPANIVAYTLGIVATLMLGAGLSMGMKVILKDTSYGFILGIVIGLLGIILATVNPKIHQSILQSRKKKYQKEILDLSSEILKESQLR